MARPLGEISTAVINRLRVNGPMSMAKISEQEKIHTKVLRSTMHKLVINGHVAISRHKRVAWCKRPVAVYSVPDKPKQQAVLSLPWGNQFT